MIKVLKKTKSICPICLIETDAKIIEKNNKVYMVKECTEHGKFTALLEKSVEFYKKTMNKYPVGGKERIVNLMIPFTHKCNLNCNFCWLPQRDREDFPIGFLKKIISNFDSDTVRISGGEPTLRDDLPEIIRFINKNKKLSLLMTNGLKFTDINYVKKLKDAGLCWVCFSFNSFRDDVYEKLNGKKLLKAKLKALDNIKKEGIPVTISVMIAKDINDKELKKILDYCLENNSFIKELRIRSVASVGRYVKMEGFFISEMITMFSKILNIDRKEFFKTIDKKRHMSCSFTGELISYKQRNSIHPLVLVKRTGRYKKQTIRKIIFTIRILSKFKIKTLFKLMMNKIKGRNNLILRLEFRSWPNKYNIDLEDIEKCPTYHLSKRGELPFCYSLILNNENAIEL